ncbi:MAG: hypothetical protein VW547_08540 [Alphaproteobacteria bacterium]|jgi:hypothetical protein
MRLPVVVVSKLPQTEALAAIREELAGIAEVAFLPDLRDEQQTHSQFSGISVTVPLRWN